MPFTKVPVINTLLAGAADKSARECPKGVGIADFDYGEDPQPQARGLCPWPPAYLDDRSRACCWRWPTPQAEQTFRARSRSAGFVAKAERQRLRAGPAIDPEGPTISESGHTARTGLGDGQYP
eukprot:g29626.t1